MISTNIRRDMSCEEFEARVLTVGVSVGYPRGHPQSVPWPQLRHIVDITDVFNLQKLFI